MPQQVSSILPLKLIHPNSAMDPLLSNDISTLAKYFVLFLACLWLLKSVYHRFNIILCLDIPNTGLDCNLVGIQIYNRTINCESKAIAYEKAKHMSNGREPLDHEPHKDGDLYHFHLHKHMYIMDGNKLLNYHFTYPHSSVTVAPKVASFSQIRTNRYDQESSIPETSWASSITRICFKIKENLPLFYREPRTAPMTRYSSRPNDTFQRQLRQRTH